MVIIVATTVTAEGCLPAQRANQQMEDRSDAAIIDQLSLYEPNPHFIGEVRQQLESEGFMVDLYTGKEVTIQLYQELPNYNYELIIFRAHAGFLGEGVDSEQTGHTYVFTGEEYAVTENTFGQLFDEIAPAEAFNGNHKVFAVNPKFVCNTMKGNFKDTAIIMMGCATAYQPDMAYAFIDKGASVYIGWNATVDLQYVDKATLRIIKNLCTEDMTIEQALSKTIDDLGRDPFYNAYPKYWPAQSGDLTIDMLIQ